MTRKLRVGTYRVMARTGARRSSDSCARRVRILSRGLTEVTVRAGSRRRCRMTRNALPARFPPKSRIRKVRSYLAKRGASNGWALIDSWGRPHGFAQHRVYVTASVVKAMLLVAYLRKIGNRMPDSSERASLGPMIRVSSNDAANTIYYRVGDAALYDVARRAGMKRFWVGGYWGNAHFSAEDQALLFNRIDRLVPKASRGYARSLLSSIATHQRWGFSSFASAARFKTFFKGGWRGTGAGQLVHEAALFERNDTRFSMAVLTDGNPSHDHGTETLRGVAQRIFARRAARVTQEEQPKRKEAGSRRHRRAGLFDVHRYGPGILVELSYRTKRNETGKRLPGYCKDWALMHKPAAFNLGQVQRHLRKRGLGLLILDAYRPLRATLALVDWAYRTGQGHLVGTYIARRSRHNTGSAVDITLVRFRDRQAPPDGRLRPRPRLAHLQRLGQDPPQPAHAHARDAALRLLPLPARVVALRAPAQAEPVPGPDARAAVAIISGMAERTDLLRVALAQTNSTVGDIRGNARKIVRQHRPRP